MIFRFNNTIAIPLNGKKPEGELILPEKTVSLVIFSHGSGSSRHSPRNKYVAEVLQKLGIGTFLFDLLTSEEDEDYSTRFNIGLLTDRLVLATEYLLSRPGFSGLKFGYFGASTGAASALLAASVLPGKIHAVVSRGGRPDLAIPGIEGVEAPTLLIVGELDHDVIELNKQAYSRLRCEKRMEIVPGATHLFEEPGTLHQAAQLAAGWFTQHLVKNESKTIHIT